MRTRVSVVAPAMPMRRLAVLCAALGASAVAVPGFAQQRDFVVAPSVQITETLSDNARLATSSAAESDWITQIRPMVRFDARGSRVAGSLSLGVNSVFYGNGTQHDSNQLMVSGNGKVTWWDNHGFVDLLTSVSRQPTYSFRPIGGDAVTGSGNWSEMRTVSVSPYLQGRLGSTGSVEARLTVNDSDTNSAAVSRLQSNIFSLNATDPRALGNVGWSFALSDSHTSRSNSYGIDSRAMRVSGLWTPDPQLLLRVIGGTESNNYSSVNNKTTTIYGAGINWSPTPLTKLSGTIEDRFFGTGYNITGEHRGNLVALQGAYSKDVTTISQSMLSAITLLDVAKLYCAGEPAATRDACAQKLVTTANGTNIGNALVGIQSGLANGFYLDRRLQFGVTFLGKRNSLSLIAFRSDRSTLTERNFAVTENVTTTSSVRTGGATMALQHKLTPITSANIALTLTRSHTDTTSLSTSASDSRNRIFTAGLATSLTPKTTASFNVRSSHGSGISAYDESALYGTLLFQF